MTFSLDRFLERHRRAGSSTNYDDHFSDPARTGTLMEMPCNLPRAVIADIKRHLDTVDFNRYPAGEKRDLEKQIAAWLDLPVSHRALFGNGAFEIIDLVMQCLGPGARVLSLDPDFFVYRKTAEKYGLQFHTHALTADFAIDLPGLVHRVAAVQPDLIVLSNPNNPTSAWFQPDVIAAILEQAPGLVLVDEVYAAFAPQPDACCALLDRYPNLAVLRSFSKLGAAAIRFGFLLGDRRLLDRFSAWQPTFAVNSLSLMIAGLIIRHYDAIEKNVRDLVDERESMIGRMAGRPSVTVYPSGTNFIVVRLDRHDAGDIHRQLAAQGVMVVAYKGAPGLDNCLRFSVDTPANNRIAVERFDAALSF